jgi:FeS assembly protein IscX
MKWTDVRLIAIELMEAHPQVDPKTIRYTDLHNWVLALEDFNDDSKHGGEKVLEAIQAAWMEEYE